MHEFANFSEWILWVCNLLMLWHTLSSYTISIITSVITSVIILIAVSIAGRQWLLRVE